MFQLPNDQLHVNSSSNFITAQQVEIVATTPVKMTELSALDSGGGACSGVKDPIQEINIISVSTTSIPPPSMSNTTSNKTSAIQLSQDPYGSSLPPQPGYSDEYLSPDRPLQIRQNPQHGMQVSQHDLNSNNNVNDISGQENYGEQTIAVDRGAYFVAVFNDGYTFRNLIEYLKGTNIRGHFRFGKDVIRYIQDNDGHTVLNEIEIDTSDLIEYEFESILPEIVIGIQIDMMRNITRAIGKKDSLRIYKVPNEDTIYLQIVGQTASIDDQANVGHIQPLQVKTITDYTIPDYQRAERDPNCTVTATEFSKMCSGMSNLKVQTVTTTGYLRGVNFKAGTPGQVSGKIYQYGRINERSKIITSLQTISFDQSKVIKPEGPVATLKIRSSNEIDTLTIPIAIIKSLAKLNNLSTAGTIKIFMEDKNPLKLLCNIGNYGKLRVYIRSAE